jgi:hypothetical protein
MANLKPIRDAGGRISSLVPRDEPTNASTLFAETMDAVGATPAPAEPEDTSPPFRFGRVELAATITGLILAGALIMLISRVLPAGEAARHPAASPAPAMAPVPTAAPAPTEAPTEEPTAMPAIPTEEPPTSEPKIIYVEVPAASPPCDPTNPPYQVVQDVYDGGKPLGQVVGKSCDGLAAAQANADALAAQMRGGK